MTIMRYKTFQEFVERTKRPDFSMMNVDNFLIDIDPKDVFARFVNEFYKAQVELWENMDTLDFEPIWEPNKRLSKEFCFCCFTDVSILNTEENLLCCMRNFGKPVISNLYLEFGYEHAEVCVFFEERGTDWAMGKSFPIKGIPEEELFTVVRKCLEKVGVEVETMNGIFDCFIWKIFNWKDYYQYLTDFLYKKVGV